MKLYTVAVGEHYRKEAQRLASRINNPLVEINEDHLSYEAVAGDDNLVNGLYTKSKFAHFIPDGDADGPIMFLDSDVVTFVPGNPFEDFVPPDDADIAYVKYDGTWWMPDDERQRAFEYNGHKINSGVMYFRDLATAKTICEEWSKVYLERARANRYEYDEWSLMIAIERLQCKTARLEKKWNDWEINDKEEMLRSGSILFQTHDLSI